MLRTRVVRGFAVLMFVGCAWVAYTQNQDKRPPRLTLNKVTDDLYEIEGDGGNVAVYITDEGVILIDDKYDQDHNQIVEHVKSVTDKPIKYIINTHYHTDHSGGNAKFLPGVNIISTANARKNILSHVDTREQSRDTQPANITFTDETSVFLGGKEVRARHFGRGHTNTDAVIYFPALRTVHTGDLMSGTNPLIDYPGGGSLVEWTKTLDAAMGGLDFDRVIPGHGPVTNKAGLLAYRNLVEALRNRATEVVREGKTQDELARFMTEQYKWAPGSLQQIWSVPGMMVELK
jgi:cyclase